MDSTRRRSVVELYRRVCDLPSQEARALVESSSCDADIKNEVLLWLAQDANPEFSYPTPGSRLGRYVINGELGRGGMGRVYSAQDSELGRVVAVKFVPDERGAGSWDRTLREAQTVSALNHPNIVTVHEVIRSNSAVAIVMELVEGSALSRLIDAPLPAERVSNIGRQIASALSAAHARGIIHRDVKPDNIMVRSDGLVKVLDFGLARNTSLPGGQTFTSTVPAGTWRYMSPEQTLGAALSAATDIFSLGLVLYELLTGVHPFRAETPLATAHAIATGQPQPPSRFVAGIPGYLESLVLRMLQRDPKQRPSAAEVLKELDAPSPAPIPQPTTPVRRWVLPAVLAAGVAIAAVAYLAMRGPSAPVRVLDTRVDLGPQIFLDEEGFALSPDGETVLFHANRKLRYVRLSGGPPREWKGAEDGAYPFWSPDGSEAAFYWQKKLWRRRFPEGALHEICDAADPVYGSWGANGEILFSSGDGPILRVKASGGTPTPVTQLRVGLETYHAAPTLLSGQSRFLFFRGTGLNAGHLMLGDTAGHKPPVELAEAASSAVFLPNPHTADGVVVYAKNASLVTQPFDPAAGRFTGPPTILTPRARDFRRRIIPASASAGGALLYAESEDKTDQAKIFDRSGRLLSKLGPRGEYISALPSPDFTKIVLSFRQTGDRPGAVEILDVRTGSMQPLFAGSTLNSAARPTWARDGTRLAFTMNPDAANTPLGIVKLPPGAAPEEAVRTLPFRAWPHDWSPDGQMLLMTAEHPVTGRDIWAVPVNPALPPKLVIASPFNEDEGHFSPDGRLLAYQSNETGHTEVYVAPYPPDGRKWLVSVDGGQEPRWRKDGKELFFLTLDYALMSVKVAGSNLGATFSPPTLLFGGRSGEPALMVWHFQPSPDAQNFLILTSTAKAPDSPLRLRLNWWAAAR